MKFKNDIVATYLSLAPIALALERIVECDLYPDCKLEHPILDIGCGEGLFAHVLFAEKIDTGIDPNAKELDRARQLGGYEELIQCTGDKIPKPKDSYRTIISNSVLEHIPLLEPVLREAYRVLAPGGFFYFTVPSEKFEQYTVVSQILQFLKLSSFEKLWRRFFNRFWAHYHYYTPEGWADLGRSAGFEVFDTFTYNPKRVCLINTVLTPVGMPAMIIKKLTNRWILFPGLRRILLYPIRSWVSKIAKGAGKCDAGGLVFVALRKPGK